MPSLDWKLYWQNHKVQARIGPSYWFHDIFSGETAGHNYRTFIEIGGFPGYYSIFAVKYLHLQPSLLDTYQDKKTFYDLLNLNGLSKSSIAIIKKDFFTYPISHKYDLVFSSGFIEHFSDPHLVIKKHWQHVANQGKMILALPNFLSINGIVQILFDPAYLLAHNLEMMLPANLSQILDDLKITRYQIKYYGGFNVWMEDLFHRPVLLRLLILSQAVLGLLIRKTGFNSRLTSPYLVIVAQKTS